MGVEDKVGGGVGVGHGPSTGILAHPVTNDRNLERVCWSISERTAFSHTTLRQPDNEYDEEDEDDDLVTSCSCSCGSPRDCDWDCTDMGGEGNDDAIVDICLSCPSPCPGPGPCLVPCPGPDPSYG